MLNPFNRLSFPDFYVSDLHRIPFLFNWVSLLLLFTSLDFRFNRVGFLWEGYLLILFCRITLNSCLQFGQVFSIYDQVPIHCGQKKCPQSMIAFTSFISSVHILQVINSYCLLSSLVTLVSSSSFLLILFSSIWLATKLCEGAPNYLSALFITYYYETSLNGLFLLEEWLLKERANWDSWWG